MTALTDEKKEAMWLAIAERVGLEPTASTPINMRSNMKGLRFWCTIVGFACFVAGILFAFFMIWANNTWEPFNVGYY